MNPSASICAYLRQINRCPSVFIGGYQKPIIDLVDKILAEPYPRPDSTSRAKQKNTPFPIGKGESNDKTIQEGSDRGKGFESEIDQLVYKLYDLTDDEIKIIEGKT